MRPLHLILAFVLTACTVLAFACDEGSSPAASTKSNAGAASAPVDLYDGGPRIAVLSPALAIILRDLGGADRIVGRHGFDMVLDDAVPVVGDETGVNYEMLLTADPTDVVIELGAKGIPPRLEDLAKEHDWTITALPMLSLDDVQRAVPKLARVLGTADALDLSTAVLHEMNDAWARTDEVARVLGRTVILSSTDPIGVMGPGSFHFEMVTRMGGSPTPKKGNAYITMSREDLIRLNPWSIILLAPGAAGNDAEVLGGLAELPLDAVKNHRVVIVRDRLSQTPSSGLIGAAKEIRAACDRIDAGQGGSP